MTLQTIMLRRGSKTIKDVPAKSLIPNIKSKKLLATDEISADGEKWVRLDKHHQLGFYFAEQKELEPGSNSPNPPGFESQITELAELLREINQRGDPFVNF